MKQYPIYCRLTIERKKSEFTTGIWIKNNDWDPINETFNNKSKNMQSYHQLIHFESELLKIIEHREAKGLPISSSIIKKIYQNKIDKDSAEGYTFTLLAYFDNFIQYAEKNTTDYTKPTVQHYRTTKEHLKTFIESQGQTDVVLHTIDSAFFAKFL
ncbi:MAG: phage integrase SAM-like domain-containing protein [Bacteroidetes bacterium]|nr:phage integrase SAM-like domain-containing protein [Bacteroidota bacterium]